MRPRHTGLHTRVGPLLVVLLAWLGAEPVALMWCGLEAVGEFAVCVGVDVAVGVECCAD